MKESTSNKLIGFFAVFCLLLLAIHFSEAQTRKPSQVLNMLNKPELSAGLEETFEMVETVEMVETEDAKKL